MKVMIFLAGYHLGCSNGQHIDHAIRHIKLGDEVFILNCDNSIGGCMNNPGFNPIICKFCEINQKKDMKKYLKKNIEHHWISEYTSNIHENEVPIMKYDTVDELLALEYKGIQVGFGVMSTYISLTRNLNPKLNKKTRSLFDSFLKQEVKLSIMLERLQKDKKFDYFIFQNGRGAQFKPFLNFCQINKINFLCTEDFAREDNYENNFCNSFPHSIKSNYEKYLKCWNESQDDDTVREKIARSFFINRRNAKFAGDKIYVKDQINGLMPKDWNNHVENIVIFNSSEDEFAAISKEFSAAALFKSQIEGITAIVEHYKNDITKHFTLRVHPNLMRIEYKYHTDLYKLNYPNLTVVPSNSAISTYSLIDAADKIIVFGSTTGIESVYWGKPVICLAGALYLKMGIVYVPNNIEKLWKYIETTKLPCLYNEDVLKYGYFYMSKNHDKTKYVDINVYKKPFLGKNLSCYKFSKILGSTFLYALISTILCRYFVKLFPSKFKRIPHVENDK